MLIDYLKLALENITHRKLRSWLTILGIVIGIAAVVALISLGKGLQYTVDQQFVKIGADKISVVAKGNSVQQMSSSTLELTKKDYDVIKRSQGVDEAVMILSQTSKIEFNKRQVYGAVRGIPVDETRIVYEESGQYDVEFGRKLRQGDKNKVMIGPEFAKDSVFGKQIKVGDTLVIEGKNFEVVGIVKKGGNPGISRAIFMTLDDARILFNKPESVSVINVKIDNPEEMDKVVETIKKDLRRSRGLDEGKEDFTVQSTKKLVESFLTVFNIISVLLIGLASISLLVGAIGIANTMYTAVLERTREIGIMKSIGARNSDILKLFLIESSFIGLIGGIIGVLIGIGISKFAETLMGSVLGEGFFQVFLPWWLLVGAALFAMVIGIISGIIPAKKASELKPVDALRGG